PLRDPSLHRSAAQPFILELRKAREFGEPLDFLAWIPTGRLRIVEPEGTSGRGIEVPVDDFAHPRVEFLRSRHEAASIASACRSPSWHSSSRSCTRCTRTS